MHGVLTQAGYAASATWGATWANATVKIPVVSETFSKEFERTASKALTGSAAEKEFFNGRQLVRGDLVCNLDFDTNGLLEYCMGTKSTGTYTFSAALDKWIHLHLDKYVTRHRIQSLNIDGFTLAGEKGSESPIAWTMRGAAYNGDRNATAFPALTLTENPVRFEHLTQVWIGDQANVLAAGDAIAISGFELTVEQNQELDGGDSSDQTHVLANARNDFRNVTLKLTLARYSTTVEQLATWRDAGTRLQAIMKFDSGAGDTITISLPDIKVESGADFNVDGPNVIRGEVTLRAFANLHNTVAGMSTISDQMQIVVV